MLILYTVLFNDVVRSVHRSSMWNKKPTRCHLVLYLFVLISLSNGKCIALPIGHTSSQPDLTAYTATALHHT